MKTFASWPAWYISFSGTMDGFYGEVGSSSSFIYLIMCKIARFVQHWNSELQVLNHTLCLLQCQHWMYLLKLVEMCIPCFTSHKDNNASEHVISLVWPNGTWNSFIRKLLVYSWLTIITQNRSTYTAVPSSVHMSQKFYSTTSIIIIHTKKHIVYRQISILYSIYMVKHWTIQNNALQ